MPTRTSRRITRAAILSAFLIAAASLARADVTVHEATSFDLAVIKAHGTSTEMTSVDRQRRDSDLHCEGLFSIFCRNVQSGEITRLDKDVIWRLDPKKKQYEETAFPSAEQRVLAQQKLKENLDKLQHCPAVQQRTTAPDTSKCELSPPKLDVIPSDQHATIAGHDTRLTQLALTQSCRDRQTGDTCDFVIGMDSWLTQDSIPGVTDRQQFRQAYAKKIGSDDVQAETAKQLQQFLAPYKDNLEQLKARAGEFKGYPLRSTFRVSIGGEHCAQAKQAEQQAGSGNVLQDASQAAGQAAAASATSAAASEAGSAVGRATGNSLGGSILGSAAGSFGGKLVGGLLSRKKKDDAAAPKAAPPPAAAHLVKVIEFSVETTAIDNGTIPQDQFEIPAGWKKAVPKQKKAKDEEFSCPQETDKGA